MRFIPVLAFCIGLPFADKVSMPGTAPVKPQQAQGSKTRILALQAEARSLYARKAYARACKVFEEVTHLAPKDASAFTDLGLCLQKLGSKDSIAVAANRRALALAVATLTDTGQVDYAAQEAEARVRKHAYFNLDKLGAFLPILADSALPTHWPSNIKDTVLCSPLPPAPGCPQRLHLCVASGEEAGNRSSSLWDVARVGVNAKDAGFDEVELELKSGVPRPSLPGHGGEGEAQSLESPRDRPAAVDLPISYEESWNESGCDQDAGWRCQESEALLKSAERLCRDKAADPFSSPCFLDLCAEAHGDKPTHRLTASGRKAIQAEQTRADRAADECRVRNREMENRSAYDCALVAADACAGLVGISCKVRDVKGMARTIVGEYFLKPGSKR